MFVFNPAAQDVLEEQPSLRPVTYTAHYEVVAGSVSGEVVVGERALKGSRLDEFVQLLGFMRHDEYVDHFARMEEFLEKHKVRKKFYV